MARRPVAHWWLAAAVVVAVAAAAWIGTARLARQALAANVPPLQNLGALPAAVQAAVRDADALARSDPGARTIGALGRAYHAAQAPDGALAAYLVAESLAPDDWTWPYHRALVLEERNDAATDAALERIIALSPEYGLAWYRLAELRLQAGTARRRATGLQPCSRRPRSAALHAARRRHTAGDAAQRLRRSRACAGGAGGGDSRGALPLLRALVGSYPAFGPARAMLRQIEPPTPATEAFFARNGFDAPFVPPADPVVDALVASSRHSDVLLKHAGLAARASDHGWREFLARRALTFNPDDLNVLMEMAAMLQATARPAEALEYLTRHEALAPGDHHALVQQGRVLGDLGRLAEAEAVLTRATAVRDAAAEYNLGAVLDRRGQWDQARRRYEHALAINPFHTRAMNDLAAGLDRRGDTPAALAWFEKALQIAPDTAEFHVNYGSALIQARRFDEAIATLTSAIALDPRDANPHNNLGIALASKGDLLAARDAFTRAIQLDPAHANAGRNLERVSAALASRGQRP